MRIIVIATGALAWRPSHRTARRAAPVDHASEEEAWWRDMNTYGDASVPPPPAPKPARKARRLDAGDGLAAAFPKFGPGGGDTTWSPDVWEFTPEADRARAGAGASAARVPHEQQPHDGYLLKPPLQGRILLDILFVLVECGGADAAKLAASQHRFE